MSDSSTALSPVLQFRQDLQTKLRDGVLTCLPFFGPAEA